MYRGSVVSCLQPVSPPTGKTYSPRNHLVTSSRDPYRSFQRSPGAFLPQELRPPPSHRGGRRSHRPPPLSFPLPGLARLLSDRRGKYPSRRHGDPEGTYGRGASEDPGRRVAVPMEPQHGHPRDRVHHPHVLGIVHHPPPSVVHAPIPLH